MNEKNPTTQPLNGCHGCTAGDQAVVRILRAAYSRNWRHFADAVDDRPSDILHNARQYLLDRARYERMAETIGRHGKVA